MTCEMISTGSEHVVSLILVILNVFLFKAKLLVCLQKTPKS